MNLYWSYVDLIRNITVNYNGQRKPDPLRSFAGEPETFALKSSLCGSTLSTIDVIFDPYSTAYIKMVSAVHVSATLHSKSLEQGKNGKYPVAIFPSFYRSRTRNAIKFPYEDGLTCAPISSPLFADALPNHVIHFVAECCALLEKKE